MKRATPNSGAHKAVDALTAFLIKRDLTISFYGNRTIVTHKGVAFDLVDGEDTTQPIQDLPCVFEAALVQDD